MRKFMVKARRRFYKEGISLFMGLTLLFSSFSLQVGAKEIVSEHDLGVVGETDVSESGMSLRMADGSVISNPNYTLTTTDDTKVSTLAGGKKATVIVFGMTETCMYTYNTLRSIASSDWVKSADIRVIYASIDNSDRDAVIAQKEAYGCPEMIFCYKVDGSIAFDYAKRCGIDTSQGLSTPLVVLIDEYDNIQNAMTGTQDARKLIAMINHFFHSGYMEELSGQVITLPITGTESYSNATNVLQIVNQERSKVGIGELVADNELMVTAMLRAREIAYYYSHTRPNDKSCFTAFPQISGLIAENIAYGYKSPENVMNGWMRSEGHKQNILNPNLNSVGIGCFIDGNGTAYWTQCFSSMSAENYSFSKDKSIDATVDIIDYYLKLSADDKLLSCADRTFSVAIEQEGTPVPASAFLVSSSDEAISTVLTDGMVRIVKPGNVNFTVSPKGAPLLFVTQNVQIQNHVMEYCKKKPTSGQTVGVEAYYRCTKCGRCFEDEVGEKELMSSATNTNIEVHAQAKFGLKSDFNISYCAENDKNPVMPANANLDIDLEWIEFNYVQDDDGKIKIWGGIDLEEVLDDKSDKDKDDKSQKEKFQEAWKEYKDFIHKERKGGASKAYNSLIDKLETRKSGKFLDGDLECKVALYAEGYFDKGKLVMNEGGMKVFVKPPKIYNYEKQVLLAGYVPVVISGSITAGGEMLCAIKAENDTLTFENEFDFDCPEINMGVALGVKKLGKVGVNGSLKNNIKIGMTELTENVKYDLTATLKGNVSIVAEYFWLSRFWNLWEGEHQYYPRLMYTVNTDAIFTPIKKSNHCYWREYAGTNQNHFEFTSNIVENRSAGNNGGLYYEVTRGNSNVISRQLLDDDGTADYYPVSVFSTADDYFSAQTGNFVYVAWVNAQKVFTQEEINAKDNISTISKNCEIRVAKIDGNTGKIVKTYLIQSTRDDKYDYLPSVCVTPDGTPFVAWVKNTASDPLKMDGLNDVYVAIYNEEKDEFITRSKLNSSADSQYPVISLETSFDRITWTPRVTVDRDRAEGGTITKQYSVSYEYMKNGKILKENEYVSNEGMNGEQLINLIASTGEPNSERISGNDIIFAGEKGENAEDNAEESFDEWKEDVLLEGGTYKNMQYIQFDGKQILTWYEYNEEGGSLVYKDETTGKMETLISSENLLSADYSFVKGADETLLLMSGVFKADETANIYAVKLKKDEDPILVCLAETDGYASNPVGYWDEDKSLYVINYTETDAKTNEVSDKMLQIGMSGNMKLAAIKYLPLSVIPGKTVDLTAEVENCGLSSSEDWCVYAYVSSGTSGSIKAYPEIVTGNSIASGQRQKVTLRVAIPEDAVEGSYLTVEVRNKDRSAILDSFDDKICYPDLTLRISETEKQINATVLNQSAYNANDVVVEARKTNKEGELLEEMELGKIDSNKGIGVAFSKNKFEYLGAKNICFIVKTKDEELTTADNCGYISLNDHETRVLESIAVRYDETEKIHVGNNVRKEDLTNLEVVAYYNNGEVEKVSDYAVDLSGIDTKTAGEKKAIITYTEGIFTASCEIPIIVREHQGGTDVINAVAATWDKEGYTGDTICLGCQAVLKKGTVIKATGTSDPNKPGSSNVSPQKKPIKKPTVSKVKSFKAKAGKKKLTLTWKKLSGAAGYQMQVSTKKNFKGAKTITISKSKKTYTKKNLKAKRKYYIRIRAYKTYKDDNRKTKKVYGTWVAINKKTK